MSGVVLETVGLTVRFGGVTALDNVDFRLRDRELRCLIGPNGAGKTTFFKCLAGLLKPTSGEIYMRDEETTGWDPHRIASLGVGIKTQVPSVMDGLDVMENIWLAARRNHRPDRARAIASDTVDTLGIGDFARTALGRLAHGDRQKVELGIVMAGEPWLVLLDEPTAGMSGKEVERTIEVIEALKRRASIVIVEHDMQFIRSIARTVTVFHRGAVLVEDTVDAVMSHPRVRDVYLGAKAS